MKANIRAMTRTGVVVVGVAVTAGIATTSSNVQALLGLSGKSAKYSFAGTPSEQQIHDQLLAFAQDQPDLAGWTRTELNHETTVLATGIQNSFGVEYEITVKDETADMDVARIYRDGTLQATATRLNGKIVDSGGFATATLKVFKPHTGTHTYLLRWENAAGESGEQQVVAP